MSHEGEDDFAMGLWESQAVFLAVTLLIEGVLAAHLLYSAVHQWAAVKRWMMSSMQYLHRTLWSLRWHREELKSHQRLMLQELASARWSISRKLVAIQLGVVLSGLIGIQLRFALQMPSTVSMMFRWTMVANLAGISIGFCLPRLQRSDAWYIWTQVISMLYLLPVVTSPGGTGRVSMILFALVRQPNTLVVSRIWPVLLCGLGHIMIILVRVSTEDFGQEYGGDFAAVSIECLNLAVLAATSVAFRAYLKQKVELAIEGKNAMTQLNAASSLLQLTCDAVVELDASLCFTKDSRELAAMLIRQGSMEGVRFIDLMPETERAQAMLQLTSFRSTASSGTSAAKESAQRMMRAHAFHTRMVDSCSTKLRTEVLQVMYTKRDGEICHLVGLRDFTDTKPYSAASSLQPEDFLDSWGPQSPSISASDDEGSAFHPHLRQTQFLDVDVERLQINSASAQLAEHTGASLSSVFPAPHTIQLFERMHSEGRVCLERGDALPLKVFSYEDMPVCLSRDCSESICGTMQLVQTQTGINILLAFQQPQSCAGKMSPVSPRSPKSPKNVWEPAHGRSHRRTNRNSQTSGRVGIALSLPDKSIVGGKRLQSL